MVREDLTKIMQDRFHKEIREADDKEIYLALMSYTKEKLKRLPEITGERKLYYISAEFLIGKLLSNNLINLGIYEEVAEVLRENGKSLGAIEEMEPEPSLGNGGLGRLAACFLDSIATLGLSGDGIGLNYHMGLFKQVFEGNKQKAVSYTHLDVYKRQGKALSNSMGPVQGMDTNGPTAMLNTLNRIDFSKATNGMVLDMKMTPTFLEKEDHLRKLRSLIETYFQRGGLELQISSVSRQTLLDAQEHPEQYGNLVVRVSGFSAYFTSLCKVTQDEIIERTEVCLLYTSRCV